MTIPNFPGLLGISIVHSTGSTLVSDVCLRALAIARRLAFRSEVFTVARPSPTRISRPRDITAGFLGRFPALAIVFPARAHNNNFFTFDITSLAGETAISAVLELGVGDGSGFSGDSPVGIENYLLYDVSTDAAALNFNVGPDATIFSDLETGTLYGSYFLSNGLSGGTFSLGLNLSALADLNAAIGSADFFSICGTLVPTAVPEPGSFALAGLGIMSMLGMTWVRHRRSARIH